MTGQSISETQAARSSLSRADKIELAKELAALFAGLAHKGAGQSDMKLILRVYLMDLDDLPFAFTRGVMADFRRGDLGDAHWAPTVAEIRRAVKERIEQYDDPNDPKIKFPSGAKIKKSRVKAAIELWKADPRSWLGEIWGLAPDNRFTNIPDWLLIECGLTPPERPKYQDDEAA